MPADPLAGLDLGAPSAKSKSKPSTPSETTTTSTVSSGPLAGLDLSAPPSASSAPSGGAAKPATYDDTSTLGLAGDVAYRAANTGTLGALDYGLAGVHALERASGYDPNATDLATIHRQNEEWGAAHPYLGLAADVAGYGLGAGKLGLGAKIAGRLGGGLGARMLGYGLENAGASGVQEALTDPSKLTTGEGIKELAGHSLLAGGIGSVAGAIPVKGVLKGAPSPTDNLGTATENAFRPLEQTHYDPSVDIASQFDNIKATLSPKQAAGISSSLDSQINQTSKAIGEAQALGKPISADDIVNFGIDINKASRGSRDVGIAKTYGNALDNILATNLPTSSPLANPTLVTQAAADARNAALRENVSDDIDNWIAQAKRNPSKTSDAINKALDNKPQFYPGTVGDLLRQASAPPGLWGKVKGAATGAAIEGAIGAGESYLSGGNPFLGGIVGATGGAALGHFMGKPGAGNLVSKLQQARHANAYGVTPPLSSFKGGISIPGPLQTYGPNLRGAGVGVSNLLSQ